MKNDFAISPGEDTETLAQTAFRAIRTDIIRGVRKPGERLRIERLRSIYEIGPTPLREALQRLGQDGLVIMEGNRGFRVAPLDPSEFTDLNTARTSIEKEALRLSILRGDNDWEAKVVAASYIMKKEDLALAEGGEGVPDSWERANGEFHFALVSACGSNWLLRVRSSLHDLCERYRRAAIYQKLGSRNLQDEHSAIAEAVLARDTDLACALIEKHFALTASTLYDASTRHDVK